MTRRLILPALFLLTLVNGDCNPNRMEDLIADLAGTWNGSADSGKQLNLDIAENGYTIGNYESYYFTGQASLYGTDFVLNSIDIYISGTYTAESEKLDGILYDSRVDPENPTQDGFTVFRVKE
ncbi:MAG: hypothetical protein NTW26_07695 [bacterium]|nr:hypothetical protein [bacterium]